MTISAEDISGLTPDEQEAVLAAQQPEVEDAMPEDEAATEVVAAADAGEPEEETPAVDGDSDPTHVVEESTRTAEFVPEFKIYSVDGAPERIAEIGQQIKEIRRMRDDGEIEHADADNQIDDLNDEKRRIEIAEAQAKWSAKQNEEIEKQFNARITKQFFDRDSSKLYEDRIMYRVLDSTVADLRASNPEKDYEWALIEADRQVRSRFSVSPLKSVEPPKPKQVPPTVRTIGDLPSAAPNPTGDDRLEKIGALEGEDLERYVGRMSADDRKKLSRAA